jgi:hypothetical protein
MGKTSIATLVLVLLLSLLLINQQQHVVVNSTKCANTITTTTTAADGTAGAANGEVEGASGDTKGGVLHKHCSTSNCSGICNKLPFCYKLPFPVRFNWLKLEEKRRSRLFWSLCTSLYFTVQSHNSQQTAVHTQTNVFF